MRTTRQQSWCVYETTLKGRAEATRSVCESGEWEAMSAAKPGLYTLVMAGIATEGEAERMARGKSGDAAPRKGANATHPHPMRG